jgi:hypothetical protein
MSAVSIPTDTGPAPDLQSPVVVHDRRVTVDGITTQYLVALWAMVTITGG